MIYFKVDIPFKYLLLTIIILEFIGKKTCGKMYITLKNR